MNIQRDSYASYIGHAPLLSFFAVAENESIGRVRYTFMQVSKHSNVVCLVLNLGERTPKVSRAFTCISACLDRGMLTYFCHLCAQKMLLPCGKPPDRDQED